MSFSDFCIESTERTSLIGYHGTDILFDKFSKDFAKIRNDNYGGGVAYFTDKQSIAITYAISQAKKTNRTPLIYVTELRFNKLFDCDSILTGERLIKILPSDLEGFAKGARLLNSTTNKYEIISKLKDGILSIYGNDFWNGISQGNTKTSDARKYLERNGFDGLKYNSPILHGSTPHAVYLPYVDSCIKINKVQKVIRK